MHLGHLITLGTLLHAVQRKGQSPRVMVVLPYSLARRRVLQAAFLPCVHEIPEFIHRTHWSLCGGSLSHCEWDVRGKTNFTNRDTPFSFVPYNVHTSPSCTEKTQLCAIWREALDVGTEGPLRFCLSLRVSFFHCWSCFSTLLCVRRSLSKHYSVEENPSSRPPIRRCSRMMLSTELLSSALTSHKAFLPATFMMPFWTSCQPLPQAGV